MMRSRPLLFSSLLFVSILAAGAGADEFLPATGGNGGVQYVRRCPTGQLLVGMELRGGDDIDAIRPLCATARGPLQIDAPQVAGEEWTGGGGGTPRVVACPADMPILAGMDVRADGADVIVVYEVQLYCGVAGPVQNFTARPNAMFTGDTTQGSRGKQLFYKEVKWRNGTHRCPAGQVAVGLHGRAGEYIDAIGLICGEPTIVQPSRTVRTVGKRRSDDGKLTAAGKAGPLVSTIVIGGGVLTPATAPAAPAASAPPAAAAPPQPGAAPARPAIIYALDAKNRLKWFKHSSASASEPGSWEGNRTIGDFFSGYKQLYPAGAGVMYGVTSDGSLMWMRHRGMSDGTFGWDDPTAIPGPWQNYAHIAPAVDGTIYAVTPEGDVDMFRTAQSEAGEPSVEKPVRVAEGWEDVQRVFYGGEGVVFVITGNGDLQWRRHDGRAAGSDSWSGPVQVGNGWGDFVNVFTPGGGVIYAVQPGGDLLWYRYLDFRTGEGLRWEGPVKVATGGWNAYRTEVAFPGQ